MIIGIVGNKTDCEDKAIDSIEAQDVADVEEALYFRASAKTGEGVKEIIHSLTGKYLEKLK